MIGARVLLIDDDPDFLKLTGLIYKKAGAQVITASNGMEGINKAAAYQPSLIILDIMMPGRDGFEVCEEIRRFTNTPVIILTALNREHDMLKGLEAGADGFLSKPFNSEVLLARSRAVMRRSEQSNIYQVPFYYKDDRLKIDLEKHRVLINDRQIKLTPVEFRLLAYLASNPDKVLTFDQILVNVWGSEYGGNRDYVHVYISHLRRLIEPDAKSPSYIQSVHGVGYIFERQDIKWMSSPYKMPSASVSDRIGI